MKKARFVLVAIVWAVSLVGVGLWAQGTTTTPMLPAPIVVPQGLSDRAIVGAGKVFSGETFGFQVLGPPDRDGRVTGRLVVKIDGEWRETTAGVRLVR